MNEIHGIIVAADVAERTLTIRCEERADVCGITMGIWATLVIDRCLKLPPDELPKLEPITTKLTEVHQ